MSAKSFPAAITVITFLALSLPASSARAGTPRDRPRPGNPSPPAAHVQVRFWQRVLDFLDPAAGRQRPRLAIAGDAGCEMDPDGRTRTVPMPPGVERP